MDAIYFGLLTSVLLCGGIIYVNWVRSQNREGQEQSTGASLAWHERALLIVTGAGMGGFGFCLTLGTYLSPARRPLAPDVTRGFTIFFKGKYGGVYGTSFEALAVALGPWICLGLVALGGSLIAALEIKQTSRIYPLHTFGAAVLSIALGYGLWRVSSYVAQP
jgi:hypothetical protein